MIRYLAVLACLLAADVQAQVTLEELNSQVSERINALSSFDDLLADPDPRKALAAMQIMIEKGDSDQRAWHSAPVSTAPTLRSGPRFCALS